jgi:hypothetical protein
MDNFDHICELLQFRWKTFALLGLLCIILCWALCVHKRTAAGFLAIIALIAAAFARLEVTKDYNIILLDGEEDKVAERAFGYLENHLTNLQLEQRLLDRGRRNPYLNKANVRFYLAILSAKRGLHVDAGTLAQPRFFQGNRWNTFADGQHFPCNYQELSEHYREIASGRMEGIKQ